MTERAIVILSTFPSEDTAALAGKTLVEEKLAACVNIIPGVRSIYHWQDHGIQDESEVLALIKTTAPHYDKVAERLGEMHPYDVPEILALPVESAHPFFLAWLNNSVR
ncbi:MAG TPA: divalent-cation tolerance protein CutA [Kofleriaceae bacterium]